MRMNHTACCGRCATARQRGENFSPQSALGIRLDCAARICWPRGRPGATREMPPAAIDDGFGRRHAVDPLVAAARRTLPAKAKNVILLFMTGGSSQLETFDPKPELKRFDGQPLPRELQPGRHVRCSS